MGRQFRGSTGLLLILSIVAISCAPSTRNTTVTPAEVSQPGLVANSSATLEVDLSGIYISKISSGQVIPPFLFNSKKKFNIELKQKDNVVTGKFLSGLNWPIDGVLNGNQIEFSWYGTGCSYGTGKWLVSVDGSYLEGTWYCKGYTIGGDWQAWKQD